MMQIKIKNMYYKILVSSMYTAQNNGFMSDIWKVLSNFYVAVAFCSNLLVVFLIINNNLSYGSLDFLVIKYTSLGKYNFLLNLIFTLLIPIMILNYYLVYRHDKYKELIIKYEKYYRKPFFVIYFIISFLLPIIYVFTQVEIRL